MDEEQAKAVAEALGGDVWDSGGGMWLAIFRRHDGKIVAITDEVVCEYEHGDALESGTPRLSVNLH